MLETWIQALIIRGLHVHIPYCNQIIKPHVSTYDKEISSHSDVYYSDEEGSA